MLIDDWASYENSGHSDVPIKNECKNIFPFIRLLMNIYRDIQLVKKIQFDSDYSELISEHQAELLSEEYNDMTTEDNNKFEKAQTKQKQKLFDEHKTVLKGMMFPVKFSVRAWFLVRDVRSGFSYESFVNDKRMKLGWNTISSIKELKEDWEFELGIDRNN